MAQTATVQGAIDWNARCSSVGLWPKGSPVTVYCQCQQALGEGHGRARLEFHPHLGRSRLRDCVAMAVKVRPFYPSISWGPLCRGEHCSVLCRRLRVTVQESWSSPVLGPRHPCQNLKRWRQTSHPATLTCCPPAAPAARRVRSMPGTRPI